MLVWINEKEARDGPFLEQTYKEVCCFTAPNSISLPQLPFSHRPSHPQTTIISLSVSLPYSTMFLFPLAVLLSLFRLYYARGHGWWFYWVFTKVRYQSVHMFTWFHLTTHEQRSQRRSAAERRVVVEWEFQIVQIEKKITGKAGAKNSIFIFC